MSLCVPVRQDWLSTCKWREHRLETRMSGSESLREAKHMVFEQMAGTVSPVMLTFQTEFCSSQCKSMGTDVTIIWRQWLEVDWDKVSESIQLTGELWTSKWSWEAVRLEICIRIGSHTWIRTKMTSSKQECTWFILYYDHFLCSRVIVNSSICLYIALQWFVYLCYVGNSVGETAQCCSQIITGYHSWWHLSCQAKSTQTGIHNLLCVQDSFGHMMKSRSVNSFYK